MATDVVSSPGSRAVEPPQGAGVDVVAARPLEDFGDMGGLYDFTKPEEGYFLVFQIEAFYFRYHLIPIGGQFTVKPSRSTYYQFIISLEIILPSFFYHDHFYFFVSELLTYLLCDMRSLGSIHCIK